MMDSDYGSYIRDISVSDWYEILCYNERAIVMDETTILLKNNGKININEYSDDFRISKDWVYEKTGCCKSRYMPAGAMALSVQNGKTS